MNIKASILSAIIALSLSATPVPAQELVRVMVMDDLERVAIHFPESYEVKDETGGSVMRDDAGSSILLDGYSRYDGGIRVRADGSVVAINEFALTGNIDITKNTKGLYRIVNELDIEDYTRAVVGKEMDPRWPAEALKAQAVAVRTYALYRKARPGCTDYDLCSTTNSQVFTGDGRFREGPALAVEATRGLVLADDGSLAETLYHSSCGGRTEDASSVWDRRYGYLKSVSCNCVPGSPYDEWTKGVTKDELTGILSDGGYGTGRVRSLTVSGRTSSGRVKAVRADTTTGPVDIKANELRRLMGYSRLPSTYFVINRAGDGFTFTGSGSGHGVGMCQWGAREMADDGKQYYEILSHYYPGLKIIGMDRLKDGGL